MATTSNLAYCGSAGQPRLLKSIAGFIDILGFSQLSLAETTAEESQQILEKIAAALDDSRRYVRETMSDSSPPNLANCWAVKYFSDNLVLGFPYESQGIDLAAAVNFVVRCVQRYQLRMSLNGFFIRGALTEGLLCLTDDIIFGSTLIESYQLESKTAIVPRILLTALLEQCVRESCRSDRDPLTPDASDLICRDVDGWWFVNYLQAAQGAGGINWQFVAQHKESILASLSGTKRHDVLPKFGWACRYNNVFCHWHRSDSGYNDRYRIDRVDEQSTIERIGDLETPGR